eukprot:TRINITY_DN27903_c0_g1_i1.p1 TRINITY_DN27903_c0_g1~~TRINITY_DN27903_c0_g1_i1.p1  ORF type:complete len:356 (+),score=76.65 TRINITY_DN27903_c0_g1_i1:82-1149(+)
MSRQGSGAAALAAGTAVGDIDIRVPEELLRKTPSRKDGITAATEEQLRIFGADLIQRAAVLLKLRQVACVSACAIFQRFYFRRSLAEVDASVAAAASLLLACKLEEVHRKLRDVVTVFFRLRMRAPQTDGMQLFSGIPTPALDPSCREFLEMKQEVIAMERVILRELGFAVGLLLEHPHKYVIQFVKAVVRSPDWLVADLAQSAWNYLNDSTRTTLSCTYFPHQIATAAIYLAARERKVRLPCSPPWWELFDTSLEDVQAIARSILRLYRAAPQRSSAQSLCAEKAALLCQPSPVGDTPAPLKSPSDDERGIADPSVRTALRRLPSEPLVDPRRIDELLADEEGRPRSRSPRRGA